MTAPEKGRLHRYWQERNLTLFEYLPTRSDSRRSEPSKPNTLLFIGGLYDTFLSVPYVQTLADSLNKTASWSVMEIQLSSSGLGWGVCDLDLDAEEIGKAVEYLRHISDDGSVVLMGHSTGSQDVLHYLYYKSEHRRPSVAGAILQAPVSDREFLTMVRGRDEKVQHAYEECLRIAEKSQIDGISPTLPIELTTQLGWPRGLVTCHRFLSLTSPSSPSQPQLDDLFSSDLSDEVLRNTFGAVGRSGLLVAKGLSKPALLVLLSEQDECTPDALDKERLINRWKSALEEGGVSMAVSSGVVQGASHNVKQEQGQFDLLRRVARYLVDLFGEGDTALKNYVVGEEHFTGQRPWQAQ